MIKSVILAGGAALGLIGFAVAYAPNTYEKFRAACLDAGFPVDHCETHAKTMMNTKGNDALHRQELPEAYLPPCATEDSENCFWDAMERGNGQGTSFVSYKGKWYYMDPAPICTTDAVCEMMYPPAP